MKITQKIILDSLKLFISDVVKATESFDNYFIQFPNSKLLKMQLEIEAAYSQMNDSYVFYAGEKMNAYKQKDCNLFSEDSMISDVDYYQKLLLKIHSQSKFIGDGIIASQTLKEAINNIGKSCFNQAVLIKKQQNNIVAHEALNTISALKTNESIPVLFAV